MKAIKLVPGIFYEILNRLFALRKSAILRDGKKRYSENDEELLVRDFFNDRRKGVYVDLGCNHYKFDNVTYYLEKYLGWSGIAVDAIAEFADGYIENRPNTTFLNFIVTDHSAAKEPFYLLTNCISLSSADDLFLKRSAQYHKKNPEYKTIYVPVATLDKLLEKKGLSQIDFLLIDVEGGQLKVLLGFDIRRFKPKLVCIERSYEDDAEIFKYFSKNNYKRVDRYVKRDSLNWYFMPKI